MIKTIVDVVNRWTNITNKPIDVNLYGNAISLKSYGVYYKRKKENDVPPKRNIQKYLYYTLYTAKTRNKEGRPVKTHYQRH